MSENDFLLKFLNENWKALSLISMAVVALWRARGWVSSIGQRVGSLEQRVGSLDQRIGSLEKSVNEIKDFLKKLFPSTTSMSSPINLTSLGKEISEELNASRWAKSVATSLVHTEKQKFENSSHYEIQKYCFDNVEERAALTVMGKEVEKSAYKRGLKKQSVLDVLAVELRDALFEQLKMDKDVDC